MAVTTNEHDARLFGRNLCLLRRRRGFTQTTLAGLAGMSKDGVGKLELGMRSPRLVSVLALADALSVDPCELLKGLRP